MSQDSTNHHYVPQGLLQNWYIKDSKGKNNGFRKYQRKYNGEVGLFPNPCSSKSSCSEEHLNTTYQNIFSITQEVVEDSNSIEDELAKLDSDALEEIAKILKSPSDRIYEQNENEKKLLAKFLLSLHLRHPETLQFVENEVEQRGKDQLAYIKEQLKKYDIEERIELFQKNNNLLSMLDTLNNQDSYKFFRKMQLFVVNFDQHFFLTGEKPLVLNFCKDEIYPSLGFALSLSPTVLLIGIHPELFENNFKDLQDFINKFVVSYNGIVCEQSRYAISSYELDEELKDIYLSALK